MLEQPRPAQCPISLHPDNLLLLEVSYAEIVMENCMKVRGPLTSKVIQPFISRQIPQKSLNISF